MQLCKKYIGEIHYCIVSVDILFSKNELGGLSYTSENGSCKQMIKPSFLLIMILLFTGS